jgi:hypothetical protein
MFSKDFFLFVHVFGGLECVGKSFAYASLIYWIFEVCLDSNPESYSYKYKARY